MIDACLRIETKSHVDETKGRVDALRKNETKVVGFLGISVIPFTLEEYCCLIRISLRLKII